MVAPLGDDDVGLGQVRGKFSTPLPRGLGLRGEHDELECHRTKGLSKATARCDRPVAAARLRRGLGRRVYLLTADLPTLRRNSASRAGVGRGREKQGRRTTPARDQRRREGVVRAGVLALALRGSVRPGRAERDPAAVERVDGVAGAEADAPGRRPGATFPRAPGPSASLARPAPAPLARPVPDRRAEWATWQPTTWSDAGRGLGCLVSLFVARARSRRFGRAYHRRRVGRERLLGDACPRRPADGEPQHASPFSEADGGCGHGRTDGVATRRAVTPFPPRCGLGAAW